MENWDSLDTVNAKSGLVVMAANRAVPILC